jgi:hypothetical protein
VGRREKEEEEGRKEREERKEGGRRLGEGSVKNVPGVNNLNFSLQRLHEGRGTEYGTKK